MNVLRVPAGSPWGDRVGYSTAVRVGDLVFVSGTTASGVDGHAMHPGDAAAQSGVVLNRIADALRELGAALTDVVETRVYLTDMAAWQQVGQAHRRVFGDVRPATTIVQVGPLIAPGLLVEISAIAVAGGRDATA